jgi:hypothetical protein
MSSPEVTVDTAQALKPVRVRVRQLDYVTKGVNPLGDVVDRIDTAYGPGSPVNDPKFRDNLDPESQEYADLASDHQHGQLIMVRPLAYVGLIESGAVRDVQTDSSGDEIIEDEELLDVNTATVEELADWIRSERPTVNDMMEASQGAPEIASRLLEAESTATEGQPRKGVLEGLSSVISRG